MALSRFGFMLFAAIANAQSSIFNETVQHQLRFEPSIVSYKRVDPIINPGVNTLSGHLHGFVGPNTISSSSTRTDLLNGQCTSLQLGGNLDMSAYWFPVPYHVAANGSYTLLQMQGGSVYYDLYSPHQPIYPFPDNFEMITGNASALSGNCAGGQGNGGGYFYGDGGNSYLLPTQWTKNLGLHIAFPDCWDGVAFNKSTQSQHMTWSNFNAGGTCPTGFKRLIRITLSMSFATGSQAQYPTNPSGPTYMLSNGDTAGCSLHADFMNAWQTGLLQKVLDQCSNLGHDNTALCPLFANKISSAASAAKACRDSGLIPQEDIGLAAPISVLPGCLTPGSKLAPGCNPIVPFVKPSSYFTSMRAGGWPIATSVPTQAPTTMRTIASTSTSKPTTSVPTPASTTKKTIVSTSTSKPTTSASPIRSWKSLGCYTDSTTARALPVSGPVNGGMTISGCQASCKKLGFAYAGVEYSTECWCGSVIGGRQTKTYDRDCNMACSGASSQMCGGGNRISIYQLA